MNYFIDYMWLLFSIEYHFFNIHSCCHMYIQIISCDKCIVFHDINLPSISPMMHTNGSTKQNYLETQRVPKDINGLLGLCQLILFNLTIL